MGKVKNIEYLQLGAKSFNCTVSPCKEERVQKFNKTYPYTPVPSLHSFG
jgi:hypothetical protein